jgi:hypothetical protein
MSDLEISKALALVIGYAPRAVIVHKDVCLVETGNVADRVRMISNGKPDLWVTNCRIFDYRDWGVIGPIAVKYNNFPYARRDGKGTLDGKWVVWPNTVEDTPQKAIALAVIGALP